MSIFSAIAILFLAITKVSWSVLIASAETTPQAIAQQITVRIDGQSNYGSGVIVDRERGNFQVLTNAHVINRPSAYQIITADGAAHRVSRRLIIPEVDLAILMFSSDRDYSVATVNDTPVSVGEKIYVAGYPMTGGTLTVRKPRFVTTEGNLIENDITLPKGYALSYSNLVRAGMSGGAILDSQGRLIGINGVVRLVGKSDRVVASGIPIKVYLQWKITTFGVSRLAIDDLVPFPQFLLSDQNSTLEIEQKSIFNTFCQ